MRQKSIIILFVIFWQHLFPQNFIWAKQMSVSLATSRSIVSDGAGNVYSIGKFTGTVDFDPNAGLFNLSSAGIGSDIFISKLDPSGNFVWAKKMGGINNIAEAASILLDASGNIYMTGNFSGTTNFNTSGGTNTITSAGINDVFVCKLDQNGDLLWAKAMGGNSADIGQSIALDGSGNVYTTGTFQNTADFDPSVAVYNLTSVGLEDIFVSKLDGMGNFVWAKSIGGISTDIANAIGIDPLGNVCSIGYFDGTVDFDPGFGTYNLTNLSGGYSTYISKLDVSGNFLWAKVFGAGGGAVANSMTLDAPGNIYLTGGFGGTVDFDPSPTTFNMSASNFDIFVSKFSTTGNFVWAKKIGGNSQDNGSSISIDGLGNIYTTGSFNGTVDFDPSIGGSFVLNSAGGNEVFISKLDISGNFIAAKSVGGSGNDEGNTIALDGLGSVYVSGSFSSTVDFDPDGGVYNLTALNNQDAFILKLNQNLTTGTIEYSNHENEINIFPNPIKDKFIIEFDKKRFSINKITITNCLGQKVYALDNPNLRQEIDLSSFESGVYILTLQNETQQKVLKIVKE